MLLLLTNQAKASRMTKMMTMTTTDIPMKDRVLESMLSMFSMVLNVIEF